MDTPENIPMQTEVSQAPDQNNTGPAAAMRRPHRAVPLRRVTPWYQAAHRWLLANTFAPGFLPGPWSRPIFGYLAATLLQLVVVIGTFGLILVSPAFRFPAGPLILVVLLVALGWGTGPSIVATLVGAVLLIFFLVPPAFSLVIPQEEDAIGLIVYLVVGLTVGILASQAQRARHAAEVLSTRLETIVEAIPDPLVRYDRDGRAVHFNRVARAIVPAEQQGLALAEMPQQLHLRTLYGEQLPLDALPLARALRGETVTGVELVYQTLVGQQRVVSISAAPLRSPLHGTIEGAVTITHDLSEVRRAEHFADERASQLEAIFEVMTDGVNVYDSEGRIVQMNAAARAFFARVIPSGPLEQPMHERVSHIALFDESGQPLPVEQTPVFRILQGEVLANEASVDLMVRTLMDETIWLNVSGAPLRDHEGHIVGGVAILHDITERRRVEEALRASEERYRTIVQTANEGIWLLDPEARTLYTNERLAQILGYTPEEMRGHTVLEFVFPEDAEAGRARIGSNLLGNFEQFDFRFRRKDGSSLYTLACTSPVRDGAGTIVGALGMFTDLTERKRAADHEFFLAEVSKLLASTLDYQETLATIAHLVVPQLADWFAVDLVNTAGQFELVEVDHADPEKVRWAKALREKFPVDPNAPGGSAHVFRTGQAVCYPHITDEMLAGTARSEEELALLRQVGSMSAMIVPLVARGKPIGVVTFVSSESGRHYDERDLALAEEVGRRAGIALDNARLYQAMRQARDQLDIILQGVADGIIVYDRSSQIIYANEAAAQMTGFASVQAMLETPPLGIVSKYEIIDEQGRPFPFARLTHRRVFAGEQTAQDTIGYYNKATGRPERWSQVTSCPVYDEQGKVVYVITIIHDLTERVLAERRKDGFISMASHELKTPVTSLKGFTHLLQRRLAKHGDEQGQHFLARMDAQLDRLAKLISELLDISRIQADKLNLQVEPVDLDALVDETVENVQATTSTHQLLREGRADAQVMGDKDRLGQVVINLLTNAIKYSPHADRVLIRLSRDQQQAIVSVQDFGIGIDEAEQQKIFERFYQVSDPEGRTYPGLGIGLYLSHDIVERHHGRLWVESREGEGATFSLALPLFQQEQERSMLKQGGGKER